MRGEVRLLNSREAAPPFAEMQGFLEKLTSDMAEREEQDSPDEQPGASPKKERGDASHRLMRVKRTSDPVGRHRKNHEIAELGESPSMIHRQNPALGERAPAGKLELVQMLQTKRAKCGTLGYRFGL